MGVSVSAGSHRAFWRRVTSGAAGVLEAVMSMILLWVAGTKKGAVLREDGACTNEYSQCRTVGLNRPHSSPHVNDAPPAISGKEGGNVAHDRSFYKNVLL